MESEVDKYRRIEAMAPEELQDEVASLRLKILEKVRVLQGHYKTLMNLDKRMERVENRLAELGFKAKKVE